MLALFEQGSAQLYPRKANGDMSILLPDERQTAKRNSVFKRFVACRWWMLLFATLLLHGCEQHTALPVSGEGAGSLAANRTGILNDKAIDAQQGMILIEGGTFRMGADYGMLDESPVHEVTVKSFWMDAREVTVAEFARFVEATSYKTEAEGFGWSGVFDANECAWRKVNGADWRHPEGGRMTPEANEPVTQVSWNDAEAYARWAGKRLPTEAEFEYAARGGLVGKKYAWGDELRPGGKPVANWWQGHFPEKNTSEDGFASRAPVGSFAPNTYGLYDMAGNVWEWCADWYDDGYYAVSPRNDPQGAERGAERVMRGGSWVCAENICTNYRVAGRSRSTPDTGLNNVGFRCARDL
jgi:formylglycine-generating enzyme required for sulfatase activity